MTKKIIIDTDIGDDIDDAYALSLLCVMPEVECLGVVTVFKDVDTRCKMARMMLDCGGMTNVPVYKGFSHPLNQDILYGRPIDYKEKLWSYLPDCEAHAGEFGDGYEFYIKTLENAKEPITIVTIGAMTNVGYLIKNRPDLLSKIEKIVIMGGAYDMNYHEYNFSCDPEAVEIVLRADVKKVAVGLDVTFKCFLNKEDLDVIKSIDHPLTDKLVKLLRPDQDRVWLHDPLTLYYLVNESIFNFKPGLIHVETEGKYTRGMVAKMDNDNWKLSSEGSRFKYAMSCDSKVFIEDYIKRLSKLNEEKENVAG